ncbi:MAG: hypothetical protein N2745_08160 [Syntrophorhabdaceae bacterium]|nr:hypothetical protein [Syntrophorhabdaceae bacterium]
MAFLSSYLYVAKIQYISTRHGLLMGIPALLWAGIGYFEIVERIKGFSDKWKLSPPLLFLMPYFIIFFIMAINVPAILASARDDKIELKKAGIYLKDLGFSNKVIATTPSLSRVLFYADADPVYISDATTHEEFNYKVLGDKRVKYVLLDERRVGHIFEEKDEGDRPFIMKKIDIPLFKGFKRYPMALFEIIEKKGY